MTATTFDKKGWQMGPSGGSCGSTGQYMRQQATYITTDAAATVEAANYFPAVQAAAPNAPEMSYLNFPVGLKIEATMNVGSTPVFKTYIVTASSSSGVTIALQATTAG